MSVVRVFLITVMRILKGFNFETSNMISHHYPHVGKTPLPKINFPGLFEVVKKKKKITCRTFFPQENIILVFLLHLKNSLFNSMVLAKSFVKFTRNF